MTSYFVFLILARVDLFRYKMGLKTTTDHHSPKSRKVIRKQQCYSFTHSTHTSGTTMVQIMVSITTLAAAWISCLQTTWTAVIQIPRSARLSHYSNRTTRSSTISAVLYRKSERKHPPTDAAHQDHSSTFSQQLTLDRTTTFADASAITNELTQTHKRKQTPDRLILNLETK